MLKPLPILLTPILYQTIAITYISSELMLVLGILIFVAVVSVLAYKRISLVRLKHKTNTKTITSSHCQSNNCCIMVYTLAEEVQRFLRN